MPTAKDEAVSVRLTEIDDRDEVALVTPGPVDEPMATSAQGGHKGGRK